VTIDNEFEPVPLGAELLAALSNADEQTSSKMPTEPRRPRLNFYTTTNGKYWVSCGPLKLLPDHTMGFDVLVMEHEPVENWRPLEPSELTVTVLKEIINNLCAELSKRGESK